MSKTGMRVDAAVQPQTQTKAIPPKRPLRGGGRGTANNQGSVPSETYLHRVREAIRRVLPAAPAVSSTAPVPRNPHVDVVTLELFAHGDLPDPRDFERWESHLATCERCSEQLRDADRRRRAG